MDVGPQMDNDIDVAPFVCIQCLVPGYSAVFIYLFIYSFSFWICSIFMLVVVVVVLLGFSDYFYQ